MLSVHTNYSFINAHVSILEGPFWRCSKCHEAFPLDQVKKPVHTQTGGCTTIHLLECKLVLLNKSIDVYVSEYSSSSCKTKKTSYMDQPPNSFTNWCTPRHSRAHISSSPPGVTIFGPSILSGSVILMCVWLCVVG